jgi:transposase
MVDEFYEGMDTENLFGKGIKLEDLTDYHLARALDKIAEAGPQKVLTTLAMHAISHEKIPVKVLYNDIPSVSVYGDFKGEGNLNITYGYSKSKRPDLKQFVYRLSVTSDKIPVCADVKDGNTDDKTWNFKFIEKLRGVLKPDMLKKVIYVADSASVIVSMVK